MSEFDFPAPGVIVDGHRSLTAFLLPADSFKLDDCPGGDKARVYLVQSGSDFIAAVCRKLLTAENSGALPTANPVSLEHDNELFVTGAPNKDPSVNRLFTLQKSKEKITESKTSAIELPCLRVDKTAQLIEAPWFRTKLSPADKKSETSSEALVLHYLATVPTLQPAPTPRDCRVHVQIGTPLPTDFATQDAKGNRVDGPDVLAKPSLARIIVTSLRDLYPEMRIRRSLSYEAIALDILRSWRGYEEKPTKFSDAFKALVGTKQAPMDGQPFEECTPTTVIVRLNSSAILVYRWRVQRTAKTVDGKEEACLYFHRDRPAPLDNSNRGSMWGYSGIVGACVAAEVSGALEGGTPNVAAVDIHHAIDRAIVRSILWQWVYFERGFFKLFFKRTKDKRARNKFIWASNEEATGWNEPAGAETTDLHWKLYMDDLQSTYKALEKKKLIGRLKVDIPAAVSHRNQWFSVRKEFLDFQTPKSVVPLSEDDAALPAAQPTQDRFVERAILWLTTDKNLGPKDDLPILNISDLPLVDRREIEDFLGLHGAFVQYGREHRPRPLNVAVFGPPGSGKSFGVTQTTKYIAANSDRFAKDPLTFNISQFTRLADLVDALHQVRNECLKSTIPVVFFDEFDSSFEGKPFGWLKYFLAPMQDAKFNDGSKTHELGNCVLVFAGGINRSFEEFNGRLRNPSFVDAKGPDFISRLRVHLNIRGINEPEAEHDDQGRYLLRRAQMLYNILVRRLASKESRTNPPGGLLHEGVARAFCKVQHFKHGARSLEAILDMCNLDRGRRLGPSDLPSKAQLEMHVDGTQFLMCVYKFLDGGI